MDAEPVYAGVVGRSVIARHLKSDNVKALIGVGERKSLELSRRVLQSRLMDIMLDALILMQSVLLTYLVFEVAERDPVILGSNGLL